MRAFTATITIFLFLLPGCAASEAVRCGDEQPCPSGQTCSAGACVASADAGASPDAFRFPDAAVDSGVAVIYLSPSSSFLQIGDTVTLEVDARDADGSPVPAPPITWITTDPEMALVTDDGQVTVVGESNAVILARVGNVLGAAEVMVPDADGKAFKTGLLWWIGLPDTSLQLTTMLWDGNLDLEPVDAAAFESANPAVITVDEDGLMTSVGTGATSIVAIAADGRRASTFVLITAPDEDIIIH